MRTTLTSALAYATDRNWECFPCLPNEKKPATKHGLNDASADPEKLKQLWRGKPDANLGIRTGAKSGIIVLDVDVKNGARGRDSLKELQKEHEIPTTLTNKTPTGGEHLVFKHPGGKIGNRAGFLPGLDVRGDGGYIIGPPSILDGKAYRWAKENKTIAEAPAWLIALISCESDSKFDPQAVQNGVVSGQRNDQIFRYACKLRGEGISQDDAKVLVLKSAAACTPPLDTHEALACLASAWRYEPSLHRTDLGNSQRLVVRHGANTRYVHQLKTWLMWDEERWKFDENGKIMRLAKETSISILVEAAEEKNDEIRDKLSKHAVSTQAATRLNSMVELAKSEVFASVDKLDADHYLIGLSNGTFNLRAGSMGLQTPNRDDFITKKAAIEFQPDAKCPIWINFLDRIFASNTEVIAFLQRASGYSLTGNTSEQCLFLLWGSGANGKSTFLNTIRALLGDYAMNADSSAFMKKQAGSATNDIARLRGARLVAAGETEDGQRLAESLVKQVTGNDTVVARFLNAEFFEFKPTFKLWLAANHKPVIKGDDYAIWRRIYLVPFNLQIPEGERDKKLAEKLIAELPGIFNWALEGLKAWHEVGLAPPKEVKAATEDYRNESDILKTFLDECCVESPKEKGRANDLYRAYVLWAKDSGHWPMNQTKFGLKLRERSFAKHHTKSGIEYLGIDVKTEIKMKTGSTKY